MDITQLEGMIQRRGYTVQRDTDGLQVPHATGWLIIPSFQVGLLTQEQWKQDIDAQLGQGQHHMACSSCRLPVLRERISRDLTPDEYTVEGNVITFAQPPLEGMVNLQWREDGQHISVVKANVVTTVLYRLVSAGPQSEPVTHCPQCHRELSTSTGEIEDDADGH